VLGLEEDPERQGTEDLGGGLGHQTLIKSDAWRAANLDKTTQRFKEWQLAG
jgi:hypothetical protein